MEAKDCIKLANLSKDLLVSRRQIEWRINFAKLDTAKAILEYGIGL